MKQYVCSICGYIYDEAAGGKWEDLPVERECPLCGADKPRFRENTGVLVWTVCGFVYVGDAAPERKSIKY